MMEWYNSNELRAYPVDEYALRTGLPNDILVDLSVTLPANYAAGVYVSSVTVTPTVVAMAVAWSTIAGIAAIALAQPVVPYVPYALTPMADMVSGHVVFGKGALSRTVSFVSTSSAMSGIADGVMKPADVMAVTSIGLPGSLPENSLRGVVRFVAGDNITVRYDAGRIKVGLVESARSSFVGPCDKTAKYGNCGYPPIRTINGVGPDEDGELLLEVDNT